MKIDISDLPPMAQIFVQSFVLHTNPERAVTPEFVEYAELHKQYFTAGHPNRAGVRLTIDLAHIAADRVKGFAA